MPWLGMGIAVLLGKNMFPLSLPTDQGAMSTSVEACSKLVSSLHCTNGRQELLLLKQDLYLTAGSCIFGKGVVLKINCEGSVN